MGPEGFGSDFGIRGMLDEGDRRTGQRRDGYKDFERTERNGEPVSL